MLTPTWTCVEELTTRLVRDDIETVGWVAPTVLGFDGDDLIGVVELRAHPAGGTEQPLLEALALLVPLGCDRLVFLASGRAWSLDDPVPPVTDELDLRQQVVVAYLVDAHDRSRPTARSLLHPFSADGRSVIWDEPVEVTDQAMGSIPAMLELLAGAKVSEAEDELTLGRQALRLLRLGHNLATPEGTGTLPRLARCLQLAHERELTGDPGPPWTLAQSWS